MHPALTEPAHPGLPYPCPAALSTAHPAVLHPPCCPTPVHAVPTCRSRMKLCAMRDSLEPAWLAICRVMNK